MKNIKSSENLKSPSPIRLTVDITADTRNDDLVVPDFIIITNVSKNCFSRDESGRQYPIALGFLGYKV